MSHIFRTIGVLCAAAIFASPTAANAGDRKFSVVNQNASAAIQRVWFVQIGSNAAWTEVHLDYPIKPSTRSPFAMATGDACLYNIKIRFSDGNEQTFENINVCRGDEVTAT
jgi:hypothetical protein